SLPDALPIFLPQGFPARLHHRGPGLQRAAAEVPQARCRGARRLARFGEVARQLLREAGLPLPAGERSGRAPVQGLRRDPPQEALRPRVHRRGAQHLPPRSRRRGPRRVAQGQGSRPCASRPGRTGAAMTHGKRIYVLDTNVLMHDPTALFKFEEHDVYLPMQVMEELDNAKKGTSEASRNARQVSRFLNELIEADPNHDVTDGLPLVRPQGLQLRGAASAGRLRFQTGNFDSGKRFGAVIPDNHIHGAILALKEAEPDAGVVFVSKDINLRIKASIAGIVNEDYENDRALDDFSLLYTGATALPEDFWQRHGKDLRSWTEKGRTVYEVARLPGAAPEDDSWYPNQ